MKKDWWPTKDEYDPALTKEDWLKIIDNRELCLEKWLHILARFYQYGGEGACSEIEDYYDEPRFSYNIQMKAFADRLVAAKLSHYMNDNGSIRFFPIIFLGREAQKDESGSYLWKLRDAGLKGNAILHRFVNATGCPYSAIYYAKREIWSQVRDRERFMIRAWNEWGYKSFI